MNCDKIVKNTEKFNIKNNSNRQFLESLKMLIPQKNNLLHVIIFVIIELKFARMLAKRIDTIGLMENVLQVLFGCMLALLGIVFTGYVFFQALINDKLLVTLVEAGDNKLYESDIYFVNVMNLHMGCVFLDLLLVVGMIVLPENWTLFAENILNECLATAGIVFLLYVNIETIWEMKSFIFNIFQIFNLHAFSRVCKIIKDGKDSENERDYK